MTKENVLKYDSQYPILMQILAILMTLRRYLLFSIMTFRCFYEIWSISGENKLLYLLIAFLNFSLEKGSYSMIDLDKVSSNRLGFIWWFCTKLNVWCKAYHKSSISIQEYLLYCKASIASNFHFFYLIYEIPRFFILWCNFLNFIIKK